jgi:hypothetical protein
VRADLLFANLAPGEADLVFANLREHDRAAYRGVVVATAARKKLRPVFLERKPLPERHAWMAAMLAKASNADLAAEVLQAWLFACRTPMLVAFLDAVGAPHDGEGRIESLPPEPSKTQLETAVDGLCSRFPQWEVAVYLRLFCEMDIARWPALRELVDDRFPFAQPQ